MCIFESPGILELSDLTIRRTHSSLVSLKVWFIRSSSHQRKMQDAALQCSFCFFLVKISLARGVVGHSGWLGNVFEGCLRKTADFLDKWSERSQVRAPDVMEHPSEPSLPCKWNEGVNSIDLIHLKKERFPLIKATSNADAGSSVFQAQHGRYSKRNEMSGSLGSRLEPCSAQVNLISVDHDSRWWWFDKE